MRKFRWAFEGFLERKTVVPLCFVKTTRPAFPYSAVASGNIPVPGEVFVTHYFCMYDDEQEGRREAAVVRNNMPVIDSGTLWLYSGTGEVMEEWLLDGVRVVSCNENEEVMEWGVRYEAASLFWPHERCRGEPFRIGLSLGNHSS